MVESFILEKGDVLGEKFVSRKIFQFLASIAAATGMFTLGLGIAWSSPCLGQIQKDESFQGVTEEELSWIASLFPVGAIFSGSLAAFLLKLYGSQKSMLILCVPSVLGWILILLARNVWMIYVGRFILGLCNGAQPLLVPIYVSEIVEDSIRGFATAPFAILCSSGILFIYVLGSFVSCTTLTLVCTFFPATFMVVLFFIPEGPAYLISKGNKIKAGGVLMWLRGTKIFEDIREDLLSIQMKQEVMNSSRVKLSEFLTPEIMKPVVLILTLMAIQQFSGMGAVLFYASKIFEASNTDLDPEICAIIMGLVNVLIGICFMMVVDKFGRKWLLLASCIGCALSLFGIGTFFYMQSSGMDISNLNALPLSSLTFFNIFFGSGLGPVPFLLMAELLPPRVLGSASGVSITLNWGLAFLVTKYFDAFVTILGEFGCFWLFASVCTLGIIFTGLFVPETKGKTLPQIQKDFRRK